jgi:hypothetical protein
MHSIGTDRIKAVPKKLPVLLHWFPAMENDMHGPREQAIREKAYFLWEKEGRPVGKHLEHWLRAEIDIDTETVAGVTDNGKFISSSLDRQVFPPRSGRRRSSGKGGQRAASVGL